MQTRACAVGEVGRWCWRGSAKGRQHTVRQQATWRGLEGAVCRGSAGWTSAAGMATSTKGGSSGGGGGAASVARSGDRGGGVRGREVKSPESGETARVPSARRVDAGFDLENLPTFAFDDIPSQGHLLLDKQRDLRRYLRLIEYEMPRLRESVLANDNLKFVPPRPDQQPVRLRSMHYLTEDAHPASRKAVISLVVDHLGLAQEERHKFILLAGPRYNPADRTFVLSCETFPALRMNAKWCSDVLERLIAEAKVNPGEYKDVPLDLRHHCARLAKSVKARRRSGGGLGIKQFPRSWLMAASTVAPPTLRSPNAAPLLTHSQIRSFSTSVRTRRIESRPGRPGGPRDSTSAPEPEQSLDAASDVSVSAGVSRSPREPLVREVPSRRIGKPPKFLSQSRSDRLSTDDAALATASPLAVVAGPRRSTRAFEPGETYNPIDLSLEKTSLPRQYQKYDRLAAYKPPPLSVDSAETSMVPTGGRRPGGVGVGGVTGLVDPFKALDIDPRLEYRNSLLLSEYVTEMGRIKNHRVTGLTWKSQRYVGKAIRRARALALLPKFYKLYPNRRAKE